MKVKCNWDNKKKKLTRTLVCNRRCFHLLGAFTFFFKLPIHAYIKAHSIRAGVNSVKNTQSVAGQVGPRLTNELESILRRHGRVITEAGLIMILLWDRPLRPDVRKSTRACFSVPLAEDG